MQRLWLAMISAIVAMIPTTAEASADVVVVDADVGTDGCPGQGTDADPYGSLQCAFDKAALGPGTCIQLRDAAVAYAGATGLGLPAGTAAAPIVIEPAPGHAPILDGALNLGSVDHWTVRGLTFDGSNGHSGGDAVQIGGGTGVVVEGLTIVGWGARAIYLQGASGATVRGNRIEGALGHGIWVQDANTASVVDNEVSGMLCEQFTFDLCIDCGADQCYECGDCLSVADADCLQLAPYEVGGQIGIRVLGDSTGVDIGRNWFHDFEGGGCGTDGTNAAALFTTDTGASGGRFHHNLVERILPDGGAAGLGHAILMFQSAPDWVVDHNIVVDAGTCGLCEGNDLFYGGVNTTWEHNTVVGGRFGIDVRRGAEATFRNNLVTASSESPVRVQGTGIDAPPSFDNNLYFGGVEGASVGTWDAMSGLDLAGWQNACSCDAAAVNGDPGLVEGGYTPAADGPAIDLGLPGAEPFHGDAPDAGALEAPRLLSARVESDDPSVVVVTLENEVAPPLSASSCNGLQVVVDDESVDPTSCTVLSDQEVHLSLADSIVAGQSVGVRTDRGVVRDSAAIGNRIDAWLAATGITADNQAPPGPATTGTSGDSGGSAGSDGSGTDGGSGEDGGGEGCSCRSSTSSGGGSWLWLVVFATRLGRRASSRLRRSRGSSRSLRESSKNRSRSGT